MSERKRKFWFKALPLDLSPRSKRPDQCATAEKVTLPSLNDICDASGMFVESKLDLNEILSPAKLASPSLSRSSPLDNKHRQCSYPGRRLSSEPKVEHDVQKLSTSFSESDQSTLTSSPPIPIKGVVKTVRKNKSLGDLSRHFRRSPKSIFPSDIPSPTKGSDGHEISELEFLSAPLPLSDLRVKHCLPPVTYLSRANIDSKHPYHPFEWKSKNLWCMNCSSIDPWLSWAERKIPHVPKEEMIGVNKFQHKTLDSANTTSEEQQAIDVYRETPLRCSICRSTCCVYGEKKLTLIKTDKRNIDITAFSTKQRGTMMKSHREAMKDLYEIEASCITGRDLQTFVWCMEDKCHRCVCPDCAARCTQSLCGLIFCRLCWPEQKGSCKIHQIADGNKAADPQMPTRSPPPLPLPSSPPTASR